MNSFNISRYFRVGGEERIGSDYDEPPLEDFEVGGTSFLTYSDDSFSESLSLIHEGNVSTQSQANISSNYQSNFARNAPPIIPSHRISNETYNFASLKPDAPPNSTHSAQSTLNSLPSQAPLPPKRRESLISHKISNYHNLKLHTTAYFEDKALNNSQDNKILWSSGWEGNDTLSSSLPVNDECKEVTGLISDLERFAFSQPWWEIN